MPAREQTISRKRKSLAARTLWLLALFLGVAAAFLLTRNTHSAGGVVLPGVNTNTNSNSNKSLTASELNSNRLTPEPIRTTVPLVPENSSTQAGSDDESSAGKMPQQAQAQRLKLVIGETKDFPFPAGLNSAVVVSPEIASVQIKNNRVLSISALTVGETILLVNAGQNRQTFIIEVTGKTYVAEQRETAPAKSEKPAISGAYAVKYVHGFGQGPSFLRQNIVLQRQLSDERTLRISGEMFKLTGSTGRAQALAQGFGLDRLSVGLDSPGRKVDFLDSQLNISPRSFNNYTMRGFHLVKTPKTSGDSKLAANGLEVFAGLARPSLTFFDNDWGKLAGAFVPVANGETWNLRAGVVTVAPQKNGRNEHGGTVVQMLGAYAPSKKFSADGEVAYANGGVSWRGRMELRFKQIGATAEKTSFDRKSPLNSIGAQPGGLEAESFSFYWRPDKRFSFSGSYNHTKVERLTNSRLADFDRYLVTVRGGYKINGNSRIDVNFSDQQIETAVPGSTSKFQIATRSITISNNHRFNRHWTNNFEGRLNFSREAGAGADLEKGFDLREQLQYSWGRGNLTGFVNYTHNTPTLTSLIVRNPQILPPLLQQAFTLDPTAFLQVYRDRLAFLLNGIDLPQTRSLHTGLRVQARMSRLTLQGEANYQAGQVLSRKENSLYASVGADIRLDAANSLQITGRQSFGARNQTALMFSFTHRFGAGSGEGFQITKLLGLDKGRIEGRVYYDLNGNGQDDPNEPGVAGAVIRLNESRSVKTDSNGRYKFSAGQGRYSVMLESEDFGDKFRASTATEQKVSIFKGETIVASFGVSDLGFIGGRVFNDIRGVSKAAPGLRGVKVVLRPLDGKSKDIIGTAVTDARGNYGFNNLRPGRYAVEIDAATLPENFRIPERTSWDVEVSPMLGLYFDIPVFAQRAVAGFVFIDRDGDGAFSPQKDQPIEGASVTAGDSTTISDRSGAYILRNLPAGKLRLQAILPDGKESAPLVFELSAEPVTRRGVNFPFRP